MQAVIGLEPDLEIVAEAGSGAEAVEKVFEHEPDVVLLDVRMPVGETLGPDGDGTDFAGAAIGFNNKSTNQDACQGATIRLRYRTSS